MTTLYAAVGSGTTGKIYYTTNGTTWTRSSNDSTTFTIECRAIAYGAGLWVAVGSGGNSIAYSTDGCVSWKSVNTGGSILSSGYGIAYASGYFVAAGKSSSCGIIYSSDGINWTATNVGSGNGSSSTSWFGPNNYSYAACIAFGNGYWVAGGYGSGAGKTIAYTSGSNPSTWTLCSTAPALNSGVNGLAFGGTNWVAVGTNTLSNRQIMYASAASGTWTVVAINYWNFGFGSAVFFNGTTFFSSGAPGGNTCSSSNGLSWTPVKIVNPTTTYGYGISYFNAKWYVACGSTQVGVDGGIQTYNGSAWATSSTPTFPSGSALGFGVISAGVPSTPVITYANVSNNNAIQVYFPNATAYPAITAYYYSINGTTYTTTTPTNPTSTTSLITIPSLTPINTVYPITIRTQNASGSSTSSSVSVGIAPVIMSVTQQNLALSVAFTPSSGGIPAATYYSYSIDGGQTYGNSVAQTTSPILINNLSAGSTYSIALKAVSTNWVSANSVVSASYQPYNVGTRPIINGVSSPAANTLSVSFSASTGGFPTATTYFYSVNGNLPGAYTQFISYSNPYIINNIYTTANISLLAKNSAGNVYSANTFIATPTTPLSSGPNIISVSSIVNGLSVSFYAATGGNPPPTAGDYFYSIDGSNTYYPANPNLASTPNSFVIENLLVAGYYTVNMYVSSQNVKYYSINTPSQSPYLLGTANPNITRVVSNLNSLIIQYTGSVGAYPPPYYYYSVDGNTFANSGINNANSDIVINNLTLGNYSVQLMAVNPAGNLLSGNSFGTPYVFGSNPTIISVEPNLNSFYVNFCLSVGAYPEPTYFYSLNGNTNASSYLPVSNMISFNPNIFVISNVSTTSNISVVAVNSGGNNYSINTVVSTPFSVGSAPNITMISLNSQSMTVNFQSSVGGNPPPYYYYSIDGGTTYSNSNSSPIVINEINPNISYSVSMYGVSTVGNTSVSNNITVGNVPIINYVVPGNSSLSVNFIAPSGAYSYNYSIDGGITFGNSVATAFSPIIIGNLNPSNDYSVAIQANGNYWTSTSNAYYPTQPYGLGSNPNITSITSIVNGISIYFNSSVGGNPLPNYYYSLDGGSTFVDANTTSNSGPINVGNLYNANNYSVVISAVSPYGNLYSPTIYSVNPYTIGTNAPTILNVYGNLNSVLVSFSGVQNAYPSPYYYYTVYNVNGTIYSTGNSNLNSNTSNIYIPITIAGNYTVQLTAINQAGNVVSGNANAYPYIIGSQPSIISAIPGANSLSVNISLSTGGYPVPTYYYSVSGNTATTYSVANPQPNILNANTFVITGLTTNIAANVSVLANYPGGNAYAASTFIATPYVLGTTAPNITQVQSNVNSLIVSFTGIQDAYPTPYYYYSVNGSVFSNTGLNGNGTFTISDLTVANTYSVQLMAVNTTGNVLSNSVNGQPYVLGTTAPNITQVQSNANSLIVSFTGPQDAYTTPYYYYSVNGGLFSNTGLNANATFTISGLTVANTYTVQLMAVNQAGNVLSVSANGQPYTVGTNPNITLVQSNANSLIVSFTGAVGAYPDPYYYYSVSGSVFSNSGSNSANTPIVIPNLTVFGNYRVQLLAVNPIGNLLSGNSYGLPYVFGTVRPNITRVQSNANSLNVSFTGSQNAYPTPYYYYSVNGGVLANTGLSGNANIVIPGLTTYGNYAVQIVAVNAAGNISSNIAYGLPFVLGSTFNVNNSGLAMNYQFNKDLLDYATGTGVNAYNVSGTVSYAEAVGANTVLGNGAAFFRPTNLAGFQPVQNITVGTNGATAVTWLKLTSLVPTLQKYTRIFEFVNSVTGLPFFSLQFDKTFTNIAVAFESGAVFSCPFTADTNWHHYSVIIDSAGNFTLYIDNIVRLQNTYGNYSTSFANQINSCYVGGTNDGLPYSI